MKKINKETIFSPPGIFIIYMILAGLIIMGFRFIFPGETAPIPLFSRNWRLIRGLLDVLTLFPALAMSALVIPFGQPSDLEEEYARFSPQFFQRVKGPIITSICAAAVYGLLFFLVLPVVRDSEENMRYQGNLYRLAKEQTQSHSKAGEWLEAAQFSAICERIWENSPEMEKIKTEISIQLETYRFEEEAALAASRTEAVETRRADVSALPGQGQPLVAIDALTMGEAALQEERPFDAHWLATLAGRLAKEGSPEAASAARLAGRAWNAIESVSPNSRENELFSIFRLKRSGYEAMVSGDWILAFYIFQELSELTPNDPDAAHFLAASEKGTKEAAFFIEEMELSLGEILTGAVFSLPVGTGRGVLRFTSLSTFSDYSYGIGLEYLTFDGSGRLLSRLEAPYAKILPITLDGENRVLILMRALDRNDRNRRWEPVVTGTGQNNSRTGNAGGAQLMLNLKYNDFLLLTRVRRGLENLQMSELMSASQNLKRAGYIPEVFEAEILNRLSFPLFFLPMAILSIIIGWRFRAKKRPRYIFIPMLPILPLVFNGLTLLYRNLLNTLGIWAVISLGFSLALVVFIVGIAVFFILSLIFLAAQRG
ncbi:MAG: hypothetical protein LBN21_03990 [Treponema sp.]|jgi:hypothetical protein|nr:hypothetical protein [Treponema sp.]